MPGRPDGRFRIQGRHVGVQVQGGPVVAILFAQRCRQTRLVARVGRGHAVAGLSPQKMAALTTATAEEEIVVHLVVGLRPGRIVDGARGALDDDGNGGVALVSVDVSSQAIILPPEAIRVIHAPLDVLPIARSGREDVGVGRHLGKGQNRRLVGHVGAGQRVHGPGRGAQRHHIIRRLSGGLQQRLHSGRPSIA